MKGRLYLYYNIEEMIREADFEVVVSETGNKIIGSGYARIENSKPFLKHKQHAWLGFMYVDPEYRGTAINMEIIENIKQWAISREIHELRLNVHYHNTSTLRAYEKAGFSNHKIEMRLCL